MTLDELHKAMLGEANRVIDSRLEEKAPAGERWVTDAMKRRYPDAAPRVLEAVVHEAFEARHAAELTGSSADLLAHAAELRRYAAEKREKAAAKPKEQGD